MPLWAYPVLDLFLFGTGYWAARRWRVWFERNKRRQNCAHDWAPMGDIDWICTKCGKWTDGWPDRI
jgi:hypothetical protein